MVILYLVVAIVGLLSFYFTDKYSQETVFSTFLRSNQGKTGRRIGWGLLVVALSVAIWTHGWGTGLFFLVLAIMFIASAYVLFFPLFQKK